MNSSMIDAIIILFILMGAIVGFKNGVIKTATKFIGLFVVNPFGTDTLQTPSGFSPSFKGNPNEMIRGEENDVFDIETPILNDSIANDTIPPRDTIIVVKEKIDTVDE